MHLMPPPATQRALRIGVLLRDNLVEEKLIRGPTAVSIGQSLRCTLSIPVDGMPQDHTLFAVDQGRLLLRVTASMTGRLAHGNTTRSLARGAELRGGPGEQGIWSVPLGPGARGKIEIGEATLLFQEMAAPPIAPRAHLPSSVRGSLVDRVDPRLAVIVALSLAAHLGIAGWAWITERERPPNTLDELADYQPPQYDVYAISVPEPTPTSETPGTEPGSAKPVVPQQVAKPIVPRARPVDAMPQPEDPDRWAQLMTGNTPGERGQNEIGKRLPPGESLQKQIDEIRRGTGEVKVGNDKGSRPTDPGRIGTGPAGPDIGEQRMTKVTPTHEEKPVRIVLVPSGPKKPRVEQGSLTVDMVLARINSDYMSGLQRCYRLDLAQDQTLSGKIAISFTVDEKGRTTDSAAKGLTSSIDSCVDRLMGGWRFPSPKDKDGEPTEESFKVVLSLQAS